MYDEKTFWSNKENPIPKRELTTTEIDSITTFIQHKIKGANTVLDFGPGKGRTFKAYKDVKTLFAHDITDRYKVELLKEAQRYNFKFNFKVADTIDVSMYPKVDVCVASLVLLHQRPHNILKIMSTLADIATVVVAISYYDPQASFKPTEVEREYKVSKFSYDYAKICADHGWNFKLFKHLTDFHNHIYFEYSK